MRLWRFCWGAAFSSSNCLCPGVEPCFRLTSPVFKCLEISQCASLSSVVVRESNVVCIKYAGLGSPHRRFKLVGVPRLTELWIQADHGQALLHYIINIRGIIDMFDSVLPQLHTLKIYSKYKITCDDTLEKMMPNLKELVVVLGSDYKDNCSLVPIISWFSVAPIHFPSANRKIHEI
ncbi:F-box/FBD/LRR-repeat protein-like protein isoform X1 [Salvia divinorum]|uniref:F-box/FBD/LRR-repeat protein-like protein isoform X1 n=1 Tax=Salvia divinorum TaxID=28513 RepID=A0ABD1FQ19_SALDI